MRKLLFLLISAAVVIPLQATADPHKDESSHGKGRGREHVKREFKEERKCKGAHHSHYEPAPLYVPVYPVQRQDSGIIINGNVRIP